MSPDKGPNQERWVNVSGGSLRFRKRRDHEGMADALLLSVCATVIVTFRVPTFPPEESRAIEELVVVGPSVQSRQGCEPHHFCRTVASCPFVTVAAVHRPYGGKQMPGYYLTNLDLSRPRGLTALDTFESRGRSL